MKKSLSILLYAALLFVHELYGGQTQMVDGSAGTNGGLVVVEYGGPERNTYDLFYSSNVLSKSWTLIGSMKLTNGAQDICLEMPGYYCLGDAFQDSDGDGLSDMKERLLFGSNPYAADSDGDGTNDF